MYLKHNGHQYKHNTLHLFEFVENMIKTKAFTVCQNRGFYVESGITSTAGQNQKSREKIRG